MIKKDGLVEKEEVKGEKRVIRWHFHKGLISPNFVNQVKIRCAPNLFAEICQICVLFAKCHLPQKALNFASMIKFQSSPKLSFIPYSIY